MNKIYFISGVCGVGKSTIIPELERMLSRDKYIVYDFDKRGVPEDADKNWRISESKHWIEEGNRLAKENKSTVICGFVKLTDLSNLTDINTSETILILLDAKPEIIRQRLVKRYTKDGIFDETQNVTGKPVKKFIEDNVYFVDKMKELFKEKSYPIIDTSDLTPEDVARKVVKLINNTK